MPTLRDLALAYPETDEGVACQGTSLERRTIRVKKKVFLFLGAEDAMLKLQSSLPEAEQLAAGDPDQYKVGAHGWVSIKWPGKKPPVQRLTRWIEESYRLIAPKKLADSLPRK